MPSVTLMLRGSAHSPPRPGPSPGPGSDVQGACCGGEGRGPPEGMPGQLLRARGVQHPDGGVPMQRTLHRDVLPAPDRGVWIAQPPGQALNDAVLACIPCPSPSFLQDWKVPDLTTAKWWTPQAGRIGRRRYPRGASGALQPRTIPSPSKHRSKPLDISIHRHHVELAAGVGQCANVQCFTIRR
jgi:hypothetical protein